MVQLFNIWSALEVVTVERRYVPLIPRIGVEGGSGAATMVEEEEEEEVETVVEAAGAGVGGAGGGGRGAELLDMTTSKKLLGFCRRS